MHDTIRKMMLRFRDNESGATLVEYGIAITLAIALGTTALAYLASDISLTMDQAGDAMCADGECPAVARPQ